jgi:PhnB protein
MQLHPYLFFDGRCDEALSFYRSALGAEVTSLMRFQESPDPEHCPQGPDGKVAADKVMHASFRIGQTEVFASDGRCEGQPRFEGFSLTLSLPETAAAERIFAALENGGQVQMPLGPTFFSPLFGMVADRFGVSWMILVEA